MSAPVVSAALGAERAPRVRRAPGRTGAPSAPAGADAATTTGLPKMPASPRLRDLRRGDQRAAARADRDARVGGGVAGQRDRRAERAAVRARRTTTTVGSGRRENAGLAARTPAPRARCRRRPTPASGARRCRTRRGRGPGRRRRSRPAGVERHRAHVVEAILRPAELALGDDPAAERIGGDLHAVDLLAVARRRRAARRSGRPARVRIAARIPSVSSQTTMKRAARASRRPTSRARRRDRSARGAEKRPAAPPVVSMSLPGLRTETRARSSRRRAIAARGTGSYCLPTAKLCAGDQPAREARRGGQQRAGNGQQGERGNVPRVERMVRQRAGRAKGCAPVRVALPAHAGVHAR